MTDTATLLKLMKVADCAVSVHHRETARKHRKSLLNQAYRTWKYDNDVEDYVERDSEEWGAMMHGTKTAFEEFEKAKQQERNAKQRLNTAVRKLLNA